MLGHSTGDVTEGYIHKLDPVLAAAADSVAGTIYTYLTKGGSASEVQKRLLRSFGTPFCGFSARELDRPRGSTLQTSVQSDAPGPTLNVLATKAPEMIDVDKILKVMRADLPANFDKGILASELRQGKELVSNPL